MKGQIFFLFYLLEFTFSSQIMVIGGLSPSMGEELIRKLIEKDHELTIVDAKPKSVYEKYLGKHANHHNFIKADFRNTTSF